MSSDSTAERPAGAGRSAGATRSSGGSRGVDGANGANGANGASVVLDRDHDDQVVAPRSAAAGAAEDPFRWRGLGGPRPAAPPPSHPSAAEDLFPWRGLHPVAAPARSTGTTADDRLDAARVVVIGLGNPILGDDGVGWRVADLVEARLGHARDGVRVEQAALGGLALMERLVGARRAILVDAMETGTVPVGTVTCMTLDDVGCRPAEHLDSAHDAPLTVALAAGRALGADLPWEVTVVAVEALHIDTFSDDLSPAVAAAVPVAVDAVLHLLDA